MQRPVNVAAGLRMHLFDKVRSIVLTSATLCTSAAPGNAMPDTTGPTLVADVENEAAARLKPKRLAPRQAPADPFKYVRDRLGIGRHIRCSLGHLSTMPSRRRSISKAICLSRTMPCGFFPRPARKIASYLALTNGGAFVLFTCYKMLIEAANRLNRSSTDGPPDARAGAGGAAQGVAGAFPRC